MILLFIRMAELLQGWDRLFFSEQPTLTICVVRMLAGLLVLLETWSWRKVYPQLLGPQGWFDLDSYLRHLSPTRMTLLQYLPATLRPVEMLLLLQALAGSCLVLGLAPNFAAGICFVTLVSLHNRNPYVLNSGDTVCRFFCLFLLFAPSGTQLSVLHPDALLRPEETGWPWTLVLIRLFVANVYLKNVLFKLKGEWWRDGTAVERVLRVRIWNRVQLPGFLAHRWFYRTATYGTLVIETALFTLVWIEEFRLPVLLAGVLFHLGLWYFLRIRLFQVAMIIGLAAFVEPAEYAAFFDWVGHWSIFHH